MDDKLITLFSHYEEKVRQFHLGRIPVDMIDGPRAEIIRRIREATRPEDALRLPLRNLMKESAAMLALCEPQLREAAGNTNVAVFLQRITEAAEAFEQHAPQVEKP